MEYSVKYYPFLALDEQWQVSIVGYNLKESDFDVVTPMIVYPSSFKSAASIDFASRWPAIAWRIYVNANKSTNALKYGKKRLLEDGPKQNWDMYIGYKEKS